MSGVLDLPAADWQYPSCGGCGSDTDHDGDDFVCYDCGLSFDRATLTASYLDPSRATCGAACTNIWHRPDAIRPGRSFECVPCCLPLDHVSRHHHGCRPTTTEDQP